MIFRNWTGQFVSIADIRGTIARIPGQNVLYRLASVKHTRQAIMSEYIRFDFTKYVPAG
jgi:hypothetical protein